MTVCRKITFLVVGVCLSCLQDFGAATAAPNVDPPPATRVRQLSVQIALQQDGSWVRTTHAEVLVTNQAAAMQMGQVALSYDAALQSLKVVEAHTLKPDGTTLPVAPSAVYDQLASDAGQIPMFSELHTKTIVFPQFAAGDTAVYTVELTSKQALLPGNFWYGDLFPRQTAYDAVDETITAPAAMALKIESHDVAFSKHRDGANMVYAWHYSAPTPEAPKAQRVTHFNELPDFFVSTYVDYGALARSYAAVFEPEEQVTDAIRTEAETLTKGISGKRAQAQAIYDWVRSHIRYVAVELGRGSLVPHAAASVLANGYGDCKDHVALLAALLKAKGIASEPVLINAGNIYDLTDVATFTGLDHVITYLPQFNLYLDSTAVVAPFGVLPFYEYGKPVIYAAAAHAARGSVPVLQPGLAEASTTTTASLSKDGTLTGTTVTQAGGPYTIGLRAIGLGVQRAGPSLAGKALMAGNGYGSDATGTVAVSSDEATGSARMEGSFTALHWEKGASGDERFPMPRGMRVLERPGDGMMGTLHDTSTAKDADYPCHSVHAREDISLTAPDGMQFGQVPKDVHVTSPNIRFEAIWSRSGNTMRVHRDFTSHIDQPLCTAAIRAANKAALKAIGDSYDTQVFLVPASDSQPSQESPSATIAADTSALPPNPDDTFVAPDSKFGKMLAAAQDELSAGSMTEAVDTLTQLLNMPDITAAATYQAHFARAHIYDLAGRLQAALTDVNAALALRPDNTAALLVRAEIHKHQGDYGTALADYNQVLAKPQIQPYVHFARGNLKLRMGDYQGALDDYGAMREAAPRFSFTYTLSALAERKLGHPKMADADLAMAQSLGDDQAFALYQSHPLDIAPAPRASAAAKDEAITEDAPGVTAPTPFKVHQTAPYPQMSRRMNEEGFAIVRFTIGRDGSVRDPRILQSSGFADMDAAALEGVQTWRYKPATRNGKPIATPYMTELAFHLRD